MIDTVIDALKRNRSRDLGLDNGAFSVHTELFAGHSRSMIISPHATCSCLLMKRAVLLNIISFLDIVHTT